MVRVFVIMDTYGTVQASQQYQLVCCVSLTNITGSVQTDSYGTHPASNVIINVLKANYGMQQLPLVPLTAPKSLIQH
jgi:viroplasmin and RNaseH domain-containing protein